MSHDAPDTVELVHVANSYRITGDPIAEQQMGNGLRRIQVRNLKITVYQVGQGHVTAEGRSIRRDGTLGPTRQVGWVVNPSSDWDQSDEVPPWVMRIAANLIGVEVPRG